MSRRDIRRVHCTCVSLLLFILLHFPTALCFASLKKHENAAKRLCHAWDLQETDSIRKAIQNCLELYEAIENSSDLSQWLIQRGVHVVSKQRLVGMISRHPLLLARALTSRNIQVLYTRYSWHAVGDYI